jgi:hypothetical protein
MKQQENPGVQLDLTQTGVEINNKCGYILPAAIERKVSKFTINQDEDAIIQINVFIDPDSNKIIKRTIPEPIREEYNDYSIDI